MGANAATKCFRVVRNTKQVLAIELLNAAQALDFRMKIENLKSSPTLMKLHTAFREKVSHMSEDRELYVDISLANVFMSAYNFSE
jgi:histidine ammonia-lyase